MITITIKINERTKAGKAFMAMTDFFRDSKAIEVIENKPKEKSTYSPEFVAKIKRAEANIKKGKTKTLNPNDIWGSLGLK